MKRFLLLPITLLSATLYAQNPQLDTSFSDDGIQNTIVWTNSFSRCVTTQADQKILVGGNMGKSNPNRQSYVIVRYNTDGTLDASFANQGVFSNEDNNGFWVNKMIVQPDQKILWAGRGNGSMVARLTANGEWDPEFGLDGQNHFENLSGYVLDMHLNDDGTFITMGMRGHNAAHGMRLNKFLANGQLDTTFGVEGAVFTNFGYTRATPKSMAVQSDGKILVGLTAIVENTGNVDPPTLAIIARFLPNGVLDTSFGTDGYLTHDTYLSRMGDIAVDDQDRIICAGEKNIGFADTGTNGHSAIIRFLANGELDTTFNQNQEEVQIDLHQYADYTSAIEVDANGHIYFAGSSVKPNSTYWFRTLVRLTEDGIPDANFGDNGYHLSNIRVYNGESAQGQNNLAFTSYGKLVVAGFVNIVPGNQITVAQYNLDTTLNLQEQQPTSLVAYPNPIQSELHFNGLPTDATIRVINALGQCIQTAFNVTTLDTSKWAKGLYVLEITSATSEKQTLKITK